MEHGVHTEALTAVEAGVGPLVVWLELVLRKPAQAIGIGFIVRPCVTPEAGEVFVKAATVGDIHRGAFPESGGLHLADAAIGRIRTLGVPGLGRRRVDVDRTEAADAARGVDTNYACGLLAQLPLDGEAVLHLVRDPGVGSQFDARHRGGADVDAGGDGYAAGCLFLGGLERQRDRAPPRLRALIADQVEQGAGTEAVVVDAASAAHHGFGLLIDHPGEGETRRETEPLGSQEVLPVVA